MAIDPGLDLAVFLDQFVVKVGPGDICPLTDDAGDLVLEGKELLHQALVLADRLFGGRGRRSWRRRGSGSGDGDGGFVQKEGDSRGRRYSGLVVFILVLLWDGD